MEIEFLLVTLDYFGEQDGPAFMPKGTGDLPSEKLRNRPDPFAEISLEWGEIPFPAPSPSLFQQDTAELKPRPFKAFLNPHIRVLQNTLESVLQLVLQNLLKRP